MWAIAVLMGCAYTTVGFSSRRALQLLGVVFSALQGGLGEASCLAMCTFFDSRAAITFWSSGTGFAGTIHSGELEVGSLVSDVCQPCYNPVVRERVPWAQQQNVDLICM